MTIGMHLACASRATIPATLLAVLCMSLVAQVARASKAMDCHVGTYRLSADEWVDIAPSEGNTLRWRRFDGTTGALTKKRGGVWISSYGWTERPDGKSVRFSACESGAIDLMGWKGDASSST